MKFKQTNPKDFHVSPFNSRKGSYVLSTADPAKDGQISITITLRSSKGKAKLVARWWSDTPAINPSCLSRTRSLWLLVSWGWTILITCMSLSLVPITDDQSKLECLTERLHIDPRIVLQAVWLAQVRKLHIWYRPEPRESAVSRVPTSSEAFLGSIIVRYFDHIIKAPASDGSAVNLSISYPGSDGSQSHSEIKSTGMSTSHTLRIHAPQFYRRMITYETLTGLLRDTLLDPCHENRSAWSEDAVSLITAIQRLVDQMSWEDHQTIPPSKARGTNIFRFPDLETYALDMLWAMHSQLRKVSPLPGVYPDPGLPVSRGQCRSSSNCSNMDHGDATLTQTQEERLPSSAHAAGNSGGTDCFLDQFIRKHTDTRLQLRYMLTTLRLQWRTTLMGVLGGE